MFLNSKLQILSITMNLLAICILHLLLLWPSKGSTSTMFTTQLIHRDSHLSPFYNPSKSHFDRVQSSVERSLNRVNHFELALALPRTIDAPIIPGGGEYLMKIFLGTPPVEILAIPDTGSDHIWIQCKPCKQCYKQIPPLFDYFLSLTFVFTPCGDNLCKSLRKSYCRSSFCRYNHYYTDGSGTSGSLASDTITIGSNKSISFKRLSFGCSDRSNGTFKESGTGVIGLGRGKHSLISQLGGTIGKKFSYCLTPSNSNFSSKISFGNDYVDSSNKAGPMVTTPIITKSNENYYYVSLEGFTVGNRTIKSNNESKAVVNDVKFEGNIMIDSGATLIHLPNNVFKDMVTAVDKVVVSEKRKDPKGILDLCYNDEGHNIQLPNIIAHFKGGDVILQPYNAFIWMSHNVVCLAMTSSHFSVFGNLAQANFKIGFNLEAGTLSFQPTNCADL